METKLPEFLRLYFWDVEFDKIDPNGDGFYVTNRIMDRGNTLAIKWVLKRYGSGKIEEVLKASRNLDHKTAFFWAKTLDIDRKLVPCLHKQYSPIHFGLYS